MLPAATLALGSAGFNARFIRSSVFQPGAAARADRAREGHAARQVFRRHVLRNALLPVLTVVGLQVGQLLSGAVIVETVFSRPGIGRLLVQAILAKDYLTVQAVVLIIAVLYALCNFAVDLLYPCSIPASASVEAMRTDDRPPSWTPLLAAIRRLDRPPRRRAADLLRHRSLLTGLGDLPALVLLLPPRRC